MVVRAWCLLPGRSKLRVSARQGCLQHSSLTKYARRWLLQSFRGWGLAKKFAILCKASACAHETGTVQVLPPDYYKEWLRLPYLTILAVTLGVYWAHP